MKTKPSFPNRKLVSTQNKIFLPDGKKLKKRVLNEEEKQNSERIAGDPYIAKGWAEMLQKPICPHLCFVT